MKTIIEVLTMNLILKRNSPTGNRTRAFHVTGGDTHHYTIEDTD